MITMENVEYDHIKEARCQYGKVNTEVMHWSICADTERKQQDKHCKGEAVWRRQGRRKRVRERKYEYVGREDVAQTFLHTDTLTQKHFYTQTSSHTQTPWHT